MKLREYGRNVQMMVQVAKTMEDDEKRNALVNEIVRIMAAINPNTTNAADYQQKLWDHLYLLADFELDVESPYPIPNPEEMAFVAKERMPYQDAKASFRSYGKNVDLMVAEAMKMKDGEERDELIQMIANIMKMHIMTSTKDHHSENTALGHLKRMTGGKIDLKPEDVKWHRVQPPPLMQIAKPSKRKKKKKKRVRK